MVRGLPAAGRPVPATTWAGPTWRVACYKEFRQSSKSGADTLYKLGQAYEMLGDLPRAAKCYEQVTAYEGHPLVYEARAALSRVKQAQPS